MELHNEDRFIKGFLAGIFGGIIMSLLDALSFIVGLTELLYLDWAAVFIFGYRSSTLLEMAFALLGKLLFAGYIGIIFAHLFPTITNHRHRFKGLILGSFAWFGINAVIILFQITPLTPVRADTAISDFITSAIFGLVFVEILYRWEHKAEISIPTHQ